MVKNNNDHTAYLGREHDDIYKYPGSGNIYKRGVRSMITREQAIILWLN